MNLDFFMIAGNLISLFSLIGVGYIAVRSGVLSGESSMIFSSLLMKITLPCTIFISLVSREYDPSFAKDSIIIITSALIIFPSLLYISRLITAILNVPKDCRGVWGVAASYTNSGFMGFPIALALFGSEGLALSVMLNVAFNITIYTLGAFEIARDSKVNQTGQNKIDLKSIIFSNINIAVVLSLIFYFGQISLPEIITSPISYLSGITTPISMIIIGIALAKSETSELFTDKHAWTCSITGLLIYPVVICMLLKFFPLSSNPLVSAITILIIAMPSASVTAVMSEMYGGRADFAARVMFIQNLFCILTIPLICMMI